MNHFSSMEPQFYTSFPMGKAYKILRISIFTFLQHYQYFTSKPSLFALPFAVSSLLSQSLISSSTLFPLVHGRLRSLFLAAGFPLSSELFAVLNLKLSQTILSFLFVLPFTLSFLLLAKASVIKALDEQHHRKQDKKHTLFSWIMILNHLVTTQLCNSLIILSANATCFCILIVLFNVFDLLGLSFPRALLLISAIGAIIYSIILANAYIICSLSLIVSGKERRSGFNSILKVCVLIRGRTATALSLAVPMNMTLAAMEALFQYRVVRAYHRAMALNPSIVLEGMLVANLYALLLVLDTIVGYKFLQSCEPDYNQEDMYSHRVEIQERGVKSFGKVKKLELVP